MRRAWFVITWTLFAAWVGWLAWQSYRAGRFPVVSRAQLAAADLAVVAELEAENDGRPKPGIKVAEVIWPAGAAGPVGQPVTIENFGGVNGFKGAGRYVLILSRHGDGYRLTELPRSPLMNPNIRPSVYPATAVVMDQVRGQPGPNPKP